MDTVGCCASAWRWVATGTLLVAFAPTFGILLTGRVLQGPVAAVAMGGVDKALGDLRLTLLLPAVLAALTARYAGPFYAAAALFGVFYFGTQAPNSSFLATRPDVSGYGFGLSAFPGPPSPRCSPRSPRRAPPAPANAAASSSGR